MKTQEQILSDLAGILRNFEGREFSGEIGPRTRLFADLGFASIDAVVLGETLENHYGQKIPFHQFLADLGRREAQDIELHELADFLSQHVNPKSQRG